MNDEDLALIEALEAAQAKIVVDDESSPATAMQQAEERGFTNVVADYNDGQILQNPETSERIFVSPSYVTSDPGIIEGIMKGISPAKTKTARDQDRFIEENPTVSYASTFLQGVPFAGAYSDEAAGLIAGEKYSDAMRMGYKSMESRRPGQSMAMQTSGAVASLPLLVASTPAAVANYVTKGTTLLKQMGRSALLGTFFGGVEGGLTGAGRADDEERLPEIAEGALVGSMTGGVTAGAFPAISKAVSSAWSNIKGKSVKQISNKLGISIPAAKVIRVALENDDLGAAQTALERAGSSSMLADAGPSVKGLLDVSVTSGGKSPQFVREAVEKRAEKAGSDMAEVLDDVLGIPEGVKTAQRNIRGETQFDRNATYKSAYETPIDYSGTRGQTILNLLKRVDGQAIQAANKLMKTEGLESKQILAEIADNGKVNFTTLPDVRQLDYITRALQDVADAQDGMGKLGGTTGLGRATSKLKRLIRKQMRREVPAYGVALDTSADAIQRINAIQAGYSIINTKTTTDDLREAMRGFTKPQMDAARQGLRSSIDDTLAKVNAVASDANIEIRELQKLANNLRSRSSLGKMEMVLGKEQATRLYEKLDQAVVTLELRAAIARNSATQQRLAITGQVDDITSPNIIDKLLSGEPVNASKRIVQVISGNTPEARALRKMGIYDEIAGVLVNLRGKEAQNSLRLVRKAMDGDALTDKMAETISKVLATPAAISVYSTGTSDVDDAVVPLMDGRQPTSINSSPETLDDADQTKSLIEALKNLPVVKQKIISAAQ